MRTTPRPTRASSPDRALVRRVMPLPTARERRLALRLRASELVGLIEATTPTRSREPPTARDGFAAELADVGRSAATGADEARAQGLDPLTFRDGRARHRRRREPARGRAAAADASATRRFATYERCPLQYAFQLRLPDAAARRAGRRVLVRDDRPRGVRGVHQGAPRARRARRAAADAARTSSARSGRAGRRPAVRRPGRRRRATSAGSRRCSTTSGRARSAASARRSHEELRLRADARAGRRRRRPSSSAARSTGSTACRPAASRSSTTRPASMSSQKGVDESLQLSIYALACRDALGLGTPERVTLYFTESATRMSHDPHGRAARRSRGRTCWRGWRGCAPATSRRRRRPARASTAIGGRCARSGCDENCGNRRLRSLDSHSETLSPGDVGPRIVRSATRGAWRLGHRRYSVRMALSVAHDIVLEAYEIDAWHPARFTRIPHAASFDVDTAGRWEFVGRVADESLRSRYVGGLVKDLLQEGCPEPRSGTSIVRTEDVDSRWEASERSPPGRRRHSDLRRPAVPLVVPAPLTVVACAAFL